MAFGGVLAFATALLAPAGEAVAADCPDVEVIFARGTGEPAGLGRVGQAFVNALAPRLGGRTLDSYGVNYPASLNFLAAASGADDAASRITDMGARCPQTALILGGFSQGAAAVSMLAGVPPVGQRIGSIGSAPPLGPASAGQVAAVAVFGNPGARFGTPLSSAGQFAGRAIDLCSGGDPICSDGRDRGAHSSYELPPYPGQAAGFVAGLV
ncbi:cutinase family protein [Mycobacterium sp. CVI_P3]|uniref:Cutinase family protein n=1 Tax=Mycobacterium pinniadriaticum TaxID=2994102 RepID=A0ABT3SJP0_9MYCO|nr:cutinase family protein [Mycobacterium pinniadriaticum]MCX2933319.1 cutinase family protein [Mycobacterium pinniadriaticum]MCX2939741.1 cutinase family protein [Mycobacterium pinniadriaticum]